MRSKSSRAISCIVLLAMLFSCLQLPMTLVSAEEEAEYLMEPKRSSVQQWNLTADTKTVYEDSKVSGKWAFADGNMEKSDNFDVTGYDNLAFTLYVPEDTNKCNLDVVMYSQNPDTEGSDYYGIQIGIDHTGWKDIVIPIQNMKATRTPLGYDQIGTITFHADGWGKVVDESIVLYIDNIRLTKGAATQTASSPVPADQLGVAASATPSAAATSTPGTSSDLKGKELKPDSDGRYYLTKSSDKGTFSDIGLSTTKDIVPEGGTYSGEWEYTSDLTLTTEAVDVSNFGSITMWLYGDPDFPNASFQLLFNSQNEATDGIDYYGTKVAPIKEGWNEYTFNFANLSSNRTPLGYNYIDSIVFSKTGWDQTNDDSTVIHVGDVYLTEGAAVPTGGAVSVQTPKPAAASIDLIKDAVCLKLDVPYALVKNERMPIDDTNENVVPFTENDRTLVPMRFISEAFGADVSYEGGTTEKVTVKLGSDTIELTIGSNIMKKNGSDITIDTAAIITGDDRTFVPLRAIAEALGKEVFWDEMGLIIISDIKDIYNRETDLSTMITIMENFVYDRPSGEQMIADLKEKTPDHPRVMATSEDFDRMRSLIETDTYMQDWYASVKQQADTLRDNILSGNAAKPAYASDEGGRFSGTGSEQYIPLALMYQLTGDTSYVDAAYQQLAVICTEYPHWHPGHFLNCSSLMQGVAICYDWMYDALSAEQKKVLEDGLYNFGLMAGVTAYEGATDNLAPPMGVWHRSGWVNSTNNWNAVCNAGVMIAACALATHDEYAADAEKAMGYVINGIEKGIRCYAPEGAYPEGPSYWSYGTSNLIYLLATLQSSMGTTYGLYNAPGLAQTAYFPNYLEGTTGSFNFSDGGSNLIDTQILFFFANMSNDPSLAGIRMNDIDSGRKSATWRDMIWYNPDNINRDVASPLDKTYTTNLDTSTMRSSWTDQNAMFVGLHGGSNDSTVANHCHLDSGEFIMEAGGIRWFTDFGSEYYNLPGYWSTGAGGQRWNYYALRAEGHNCYVINPNALEDQVIKSNAAIYRTESKPRGAFSIVDLHETYGTAVKDAFRGVWLTNNRNATVVQDEVTLAEPSEFWWFAHTQAQVTVAADGRSAILEQNGKRLWAGIIGQEDAKFEVMDPMPLPSSPVQSIQGENSRAGYRKLAIHLPEVSSVNMAVEFKLLAAGEETPDFIYEYTKLADWSVPDGAIAHPKLTDLQMDGATIEGFSPDTTSYLVRLPYGTTEIPTFAATPDADSTVEITQVSSMPGSCTIKVMNKEDPTMYTMYDVMVRVKSDVEVIASSAQDGNPAEHAIDGDITTRWAAEGDQWILFEFANPKEVSSVWMAFWKCAERKILLDIEISEDGENFKQVFSGQSTLDVDELEEFSLGGTYTLKAVRVNVHGTTTGAWNSLLEAEFR